MSSRVRRAGAVGFWSPAVHGLLCHLEAAGFPAPPVFDIAYALEYAAPFRDDAECQRWLRYPRPPDRRRRIAVFCDAYGIAVPEDITARVAWQQRLVLRHCEALARQGVEPQATWVREGYPETVRARIDWTEAFAQTTPSVR